MKTKSLFISTIAMVVMLVVALSVGTFAWFASQESVNASGATVASVQSTDSAIGLGWDSGSNAVANSVILGAGSLVRPMIPTGQPSAAAGTTGAPNLAFNEALLKSTADAEPTYVIGSHAGATPWKQNNGAPNPITTTDNLFIGNLNANDVTVTTTVTVNEHTDGADLNDLLRVTIYVKGTGESAQAEYIGTWGAGNAYAYEFTDTDIGNSPITTVENSANEITKLTSADAGATFTLTANGSKQVWIYAWLEGTKLSTSNMHLAKDTPSSTGFTVNFTAAHTPSSP